MKKVRVFFAAAALLLATTGVVVGKSKFSALNAANLYYETGGVKHPLGNGAITAASSLEYFTNGTSPTGSAVSITIGANPSTSLYTLNGSTYYPVYQQ